MLYPLSYGGSGGTTIPAAAAAARNRRDPGVGGAAGDPAGGSRSRAPRRAPIPLPGDPRAALRPDRRRPWRTSPPRARSRCPAACPRRSRWSARGRRATATTPPTSRSSSPSRPGSRRATSRRWSPTRLEAADGIAGGRGGRARASSTSASTPAPRAPSPTTSSRPGRRTAAPRRAGKQKVNIEFVSANPTGPVTLASARWAAVGDTLARLLEASGYEVTREYYFNDHGAQIDRFSRSLLAAARHEPTPEDGYPGQYITEIAEQVVADHPEAPGLPDDEALEAFRAYGVGADVRRDQADPRATSGCRSTSTSTRTTSTSPAPPTARSARLRELGNIYEKDGAVWLRTEKYGDDKDRVIVKSDGHGAYISGDAAYYLDKRERGFDRCIILLGADHHGYVGRMMALCAAFGDEPGRQPRDHHRPDGQPAQPRLGRADGQAHRQHRHAARPGRGDRRRRRPLRAGAQLARDQPRHRPRPLDQGHQRQPGLLRAVRPRPGLLDPAQRRGARPRARLAPRAAHPREGG